MSALIVLLFVAALVAYVYMAIWGWDKILASGLQSQIQPDEAILFKSRATRSSMKFPAVVLGPRHGLVAVTNRRLILVFWKLLLPVRTIEILPIENIREANIYRVFAVSQVQLAVGDRKHMLIPMLNRFWPYSRQPGEQFVEALRSVSDGRISSVTSGFGDMIRSQVEHKR